MGGEKFENTGKEDTYGNYYSEKYPEEKKGNEGINNGEEEMTPVEKAFYEKLLKLKGSIENSKKKKNLKNLKTKVKDGVENNKNEEEGYNQKIEEEDLLKENIEKLSPEEMEIMQKFQPKIWSEYLNPARRLYLRQEGKEKITDEIYDYIIKNKYKLHYIKNDDGSISIKSQNNENQTSIKINEKGEIYEILNKNGKKTNINNSEWDNWDKVQKRISERNRIMFNDSVLPTGAEKEFYGMFTYELPHKIAKLNKMRGELFEKEFENEYYKEFLRLLPKQTKNLDERYGKGKYEGRSKVPPVFLVKKRISKKDPNKYKNELEVKFGFKYDEKTGERSPLSSKKILGITTEGHIMIPTDKSNTMFKPWKRPEEYKNALKKDYERWWKENHSDENE